jgi:hypothetical protein
MVLLNQTEDNSVDLIFTSPPFDLIKKKKYGNKTGDEYQDWMLAFGKEFYRVLKPTGSLVLDLGGGWTSGIPTKNLYEYRLLLNFCDLLDFHAAPDGTPGAEGLSGLGRPSSMPVDELCWSRTGRWSLLRRRRSPRACLRRRLARPRLAARRRCVVRCWR